MLSEDEFSEVVMWLNSVDAGKVSSALETLAQEPIYDARLLPILEALLADTRVCVTGIASAQGSWLGEIRFLAVHALAAVRGILHIDEPVILYNITNEIHATALSTLAREAGIVTSKHGLEGSFEKFERLRDLGKLPTRTLMKGSRTIRDVSDMISALQHKSPIWLWRVFNILLENPVNDKRLLPHLEALLTETWALNMMGTYICEVRYRAAQVLAAERGLLGIDEPVSLSGVTQPIVVSEIFRLGEEAGMENLRGRGLRYACYVFDQLRTAGKLPTFDLTFPPTKKDEIEGEGQ